MILSELFPSLGETFEIRRVVTCGKEIRIEARSRCRQATCPTCGQGSERTHSWYTRHVWEQPCAGRPVQFVLQVHRFRCLNAQCRRQTFVEAAARVAPRWARRTPGQEQALLAIGRALGGQAGARLAQQMGLRAASASTLLRVVQRHALSASPPVRVVGIDDWAWRRGQRYGTILVDLVRGRPVGLLQDYSVKAIAAWLQTQPQVQVVVRDRSPVGIAAATLGAPQAVQVADRFHLLLNLTDRLTDGFAHHPPPRAVPGEASSERAPPAEPIPVPLSAQGPCFEQMQRLRTAGWSYRAIAQVVGVSYKTVERWLKRGQAPAPSQPVLRQPTHRAHTAAPTTRRLGPKRAARLFVRNPEDLSPEQRTQLAQVLTERADLQPIYELAQAFVRLVPGGPSSALEPWLVEAEQAAWPELRQFAAGLREDQAAVEAALRLPYSTGPVEGQITRLKLLKRQMYGRARLPLLRARVLARA